MKVYAFGRETAPTILLLPGTCCHWKGNFGHVIPLLAENFCVLCVRLGMELAGTRSFGEAGKLYELIKYPDEARGGSARSEKAI